MLIEKYDEKPKFEIGFSPLYFISYPLYNIQCRSILHKYLNHYDTSIAYNDFINIYKDEGLKGLYNGVIPMLAHIVSKRSIYYLLENIHYSLLKRIRKEKKRDSQDKKGSMSNYENRVFYEKENTNNFIGDVINFNIVKHMNFVKEENNCVKKKKKKKYFHLSFYHTLYEYISSILSYPLLNISTKMIIFQNNSKSLLQSKTERVFDFVFDFVFALVLSLEPTFTCSTRVPFSCFHADLRNIIHLTYAYDGVYGFFRGINNFLIIQSFDKLLNCFLYKTFSNRCSYDKVLTIKVVLSTCLNTIIAPYIQYSILNRSQSYVPGLCKDTTFNQFFRNFHWKSHLSNVSVGLAVAGVQLIIIALMPKDTPKNDEVVHKEKDEYF
ncbi:conserved Plasmodium protein, unknown function [Plasmodium ovale wallikeri]|uniref:Mitochondrial carrier protein n=1 Tax=Plasmodium ovale wallikeri TaxID=864142 RepID=A0A1A8YGG0_PLAOA|nr:conserved Plasmodium protein, unknown function [Plasmodium ovale wallikeri]